MKRCTKCKMDKPLSQFYRMCTSEDGHRPDCRECSLVVAQAWRNKHPKRFTKIYLTEPWRRTLVSIKQRIRRQPHYAAVRCTLTHEQLRMLWERDQAHTMRSPTIDRIDPNGDYNANNCRYLERSDNMARTIAADGHRQWSRYSDACLDCGRSDAIPASRGVCATCYARKRRGYQPWRAGGPGRKPKYAVTTQ